jgi:hypothetical protein
MAFDVDWVIRNLWHRVLPDGWLIIEDLAVQWRPEWGGDADNANGSHAIVTLHQYLNSLLVEQHGHDALAEFHAYPQIVFMRKARA